MGADDSVSVCGYRCIWRVRQSCRYLSAPVSAKAGNSSGLLSAGEEHSAPSPVRRRRYPTFAPTGSYGSSVRPIIGSCSGRSGRHGGVPIRGGVLSLCTAPAPRSPKGDGRLIALPSSRLRPAAALNRPTAHRAACPLFARLDDMPADRARARAVKELQNIDKYTQNSKKCFVLLSDMLGCFL